MSVSIDFEIYKKKSTWKELLLTFGVLNLAPEILQAKGYGREVDMWSVGVITYILLCGFPPFYNDNVPLLFEAIMKADFDYPADYWDHISDDGKKMRKEISPSANTK
jgi:serine/threonine protein kinase